MVMFNEPTESEQRAFTAGEAQFKFAAEHGILFFLCKFGAGNWMDAPYHRAFSRVSSLPDDIQSPDGFALHCMLIDAGTGILVAQRVIGLQTDFSNKLLAEIKQQPTKIDPITYNNTLYDVCSMYKTSDLVARAVG